jgi:lysophospholipase L1-like esterase
MKTILCYGDSNTWGFVPGSANYEIFYLERYTCDVRWTEVLQQKLGPDYYVIEEGLNGRTTNVDYAEWPGKNGKTFS